MLVLLVLPDLVPVPGLVSIPYQYWYWYNSSITWITTYLVLYILYQVGPRSYFSFCFHSFIVAKKWFSKSLKPTRRNQSSPSLSISSATDGFELMQFPSPSSTFFHLPTSSTPPQDFQNSSLCLARLFSC